MHGFRVAYMFSCLYVYHLLLELIFLFHSEGERDSDKRLLVIHFFNLEFYYAGNKFRDFKIRCSRVCDFGPNVDTFIWTRELSKSSRGRSRNGGLQNWSPFW